MWDVGRWIRRQVYGDGRVRWLFWVDVWGEWKGGFVWVGEGVEGSVMSKRLKSPPRLKEKKNRRT